MNAIQIIALCVGAVCVLLLIGFPIVLLLFTDLGHNEPTVPDERGCSGSHGHASRNKESE